MDRFDAVAVVGCLVLVAASSAVEGILVAAAFGGFLFSLSGWRLYEGRPWEALGWLAWVGTAVLVVVAPSGIAFLTGVGSSIVVGLACVAGSRLELLPAIWDAEEV